MTAAKRIARTFPLEAGIADAAALIGERLEALGIPLEAISLAVAAQTAEAGLAAPRRFSGAWQTPLPVPARKPTDWI